MSFSFLGQIPSSKSLMNRAYVLQSFFPDFQVKGFSKAEDVELMKKGIGRLKNAFEISCGHAGTVLRFLALRSSREPGQHILVGERRLFERPQGELLRVLSQLGVRAEIKELTPTKKALVINSQGWQLQGNALHVSLQKSSQFASAVLLSCWNLEKDLFLKFDLSDKEKIPSYSYLEMTQSFLTQMGMKIKIQDGEVFIASHQRPQVFQYNVEPDMSTAAVVSALGVVGGSTTILNFPSESLQPDYIFPLFLKDMGCSVEFRFREKNTHLYVEKPSYPLKGLQVDLKDNPDLFPVFSILCALSKGVSVLRGAEHLSYKESHRIQKISELLTQIHCPHHIFSDGIEIQSDALPSVPPFCFDTDQDHRLAMSAGILKLAGYNIEIKNPHVVDKSFPEFWSLF